ncbi:MAG TPA: iron-sulfur cluster repair di-iron protein [Acidobacteriaceae bacterium]|jgi:regulator of cell morphogenesis and NO signaling|nr:iron-sulfur cluster repair di-iron protein [Acidobacteriaceae bacterium]
MNAAATTVRDIALEQPASIRVFEKFGIDYCCGGRKPLAEACQERSLDLETVLAALETAGKGGSEAAQGWASASLEGLCEHIVRTHHEYVRREIPRLWQLAQKVVARHGDTRPELVRMQQLIRDAGEDLIRHLGKEEQILFPSIVNMERNLSNCGPRSLGCFESVRKPIQVMMAEHDAAGDALAQIRRLSHDFVPPEGACPTYIGFYRGLSEFEQDLHQHVHLENNILFPRAIEMDVARQA